MRDNQKNIAFHLIDMEFSFIQFDSILIEIDFFHVIETEIVAIKFKSISL